jgi:hypothetical protein
VRPADTSPEAWELLVELNRNLEPGKKLQMIFELSDSLWSLAQASVRKQYPHADEREVFLRTAARRLDRETMIKVYGFDPDCA